MAENTITKTEAPTETPKEYDFTIDVDQMDEKTKTLYLLMRHRAAVRNDNAMLPDGRKLTQRDIERVLGQTFKELEIQKKCCGG